MRVAVTQKGYTYDNYVQTGGGPGNPPSRWDRFVNWLNSPAHGGKPGETITPGFTVDEYKAELAKNPEFVRKMEMAGAVIGLFTPGSNILSIFRIKGAVQATEYTLTKTVANSLATRPYLNSPLLVREIMATGTGVADASFAGGMNWVVQGTFNGSSKIVTD